MGLYPGDSPGNYVKGDVFMDLSVVNTELLQKKFQADVSRNVPSPCHAPFLFPFQRKARHSQ